MKYAVAIDIGGTNTRVALIDEELNIVSREQFSTDNKEPEITLNKISDIVKAFDKDITGIGMSCPGPLDLINEKTAKLCSTSQYLQVLVQDWLWIKRYI